MDKAQRYIASIGSQRLSNISNEETEKDPLSPIGIKNKRVNPPYTTNNGPIMYIGMYTFFYIHPYIYIYIHIYIYATTKFQRILLYLFVLRLCLL